jgi:hypothetical protein
VYSSRFIAATYPDPWLILKGAATNLRVYNASELITVIKSFIVEVTVVDDLLLRGKK